jgi:predicted dehydrogenase
MPADALRPIRLGLIGTGLAVEKLHWPVLRQMPDRYVVTAYSDHSPEQARHFVSYSGVAEAAYCTDYHDVLKRDDVEAVLITLPIPLLYPVAREALSAGKHVLCEKPTGTDEDQAWAFVALAQEYPDQTVLIGENIFYRDDLRLARSLLDAGAIGRLHLMAWRVVGQLVPRSGTFSGTPWRQRPGYRGGAHLDAGVHNVAQIRLLCGDATKVHGAIQWANSTIDAPSDLTLNLEFDSGAIGNYTASYPELAVPREPNEMRMYGTDGVLVLNGARGERRVTLHRADGSTERHTFQGIDNGYYGELRNFSDAVVHGEPVVGTIRQSFTNMLTILRGLDSAEKGAVVSLADLADGRSGVPLWRPRGASGLFDGLPGSHTVATDAAQAGDGSG